MSWLNQDNNLIPRNKVHCPKCNSDKLSVIETRTDGISVRRRRECQTCQYRFSTYERIEYSLPLVIKKDSRREVFKSDKLRQGLIRACEKRPVGLDKIDEVVESIERKLAETGLKEIDSKEIGLLVMEGLKNLDKVAYVRFASVYNEFSDIRQFLETLEDLK